MSCDPSYISPMLVFDPDPPTTKAVSKPGKRCGIRSLLYGLQPFFAVAFALATKYGVDIGLVSDFTSGILITIAFVLLLLSIPSATAGVVFGIIGHDTEGKLYATIGLVLSLVSILSLLVLSASLLASFVWFS